MEEILYMMYIIDPVYTLPDPFCRYVVLEHCHTSMQGLCLSCSRSRTVQLQHNTAYTGGGPNVMSFLLLLCSTLEWVRAAGFIWQSTWAPWCTHAFCVCLP